MSANGWDFSDEIVRDELGSDVRLRCPHCGTTHYRHEACPGCSKFPMACRDCGKSVPYLEHGRQGGRCAPCLESWRAENDRRFRADWDRAGRELARQRALYAAKRRNWYEREGVSDGE